jgi:excinuclease ABC subunit C
VAIVYSSYISEMDEQQDQGDIGRNSLQSGAELIRNHVLQLPDTPGVYRMISEKGDVLYVGKAKSLKKRVTSYTQTLKLPLRLQRMVAQTVSMEFVHTRTEVEALLLESNLIKKLKPRYNVLLRDDKSFPYVLIAEDHDFPQVVKHRGAKKRKGQYFGPFASAGNVNHTIYILQRAFLLRNCSDTVFAHRTRPCLQYHIKRCTAPCVGLVSKEAYAKQVEHAEQFLSGESKAIQQELSASMMMASEQEHYEEAAQIRDRIRALTSMQVHQDINVEGLKDADVFGVYMARGQACVQVFFFRAGANYGGRAYFPRHAKDETPEEILGPFLAQFYENKPVPHEIVLSHAIEEVELLSEALSSKADFKVSVQTPQRGARLKVIEFAVRNAKAALERHLLEKAHEGEFLAGVAELFGMDEPPSRIEVYDNSHISGTNMVGGMIVAGPEGFNKSAYRKFNIKSADAADDYGMMREVMERRFKRAIKEMPEMEGEGWPDLLLIDGGQGQFSACRAVLEEYGVLDRVTLVAIAKGEDRNAGRERFFIEGRAPFQLPINDPVLHYLQRLRDEVHRFAIGSHRIRRAQDITANPLDEIAGIGAKRKKALLLYFGSAKDIADAGVEDLQKVEGVSKAVAQKIYDHFH